MKDVLQKTMAPNTAGIHVRRNVLHTNVVDHEVCCGVYWYRYTHTSNWLSC